MSLKDKLEKSKVSRRTFLKGVGVAGATASLYGCGGSGGPKSYLEETSNLTPPKITESVVPGATPHNCGGRCVSRYYIKDGVVKRIVTDEHTEVNAFGTAANDPQRRSCVRCHSRKQWFYRNDRILYPLKQTKSRGDITGFVRISWDQAFSEIGTQLKDIITTYGPETVHSIYNSADNATGWSVSSVDRLFNLFGGALMVRQDYSWPAIEHVSPFVEGYWMDASNSRSDALNAEHLFLWSFNPHEAIWGTQTSWYLTQMKEAGKPITIIDTRVSKTAATLGSDLVTPAPCTDSALILAIMHELLTNKFTADDITFIKKYVTGFFDDVAGGVPAGASLSAYILGGSIQHPHNAGVSIYPATIGYNVNTTDPLYGKTTNIYGQVAKTPEWAAAITGVAAAKIREMATLFYSKKCTTWMGSGFQRNTESEQVIWLLRILSAITKNFGTEGCGSGMQEWAWVVGPDTKMSLPNGVDLSSQLYDTSELTVNKDIAGTRGTLPVFIILDAIENGGTGTSRWNDGQVKRLKKGIKAVFNVAGNALANQNGDVNLAKTILSDKSKAKLLVTCDFFMTSSALMCDYVLPGVMPMEKPGAATGWMNEEILCIQEVLTKPGEAKSEYDICAGIASAMGKGAQYTEGKTMEQRLSEGWAAGGFSITWDEFKKQGIYKPTLPVTIRYKDFRNNPVASPLATATGKFEAYSLAMMEDYQARGYNNFDTTGTLMNNGLIMDKKRPAGSNSRRFVYPIPMYIPTVEGRHADGTHPDPLGREAKGYTFTLHTWHMQYRSHSTLNNVAYLNECFKADINGNPAFLNPSRNYSDGVWDDGVYEPVWVNAIDAQKLGITTGNRVLISNDRGQAYATAVVTARMPPNVLGIGQGAWHYKINGIDVGGCANTLTHARPARISQGMTLANDCRVKIEKA